MNCMFLLIPIGARLNTLITYNIMGLKKIEMEMCMWKFFFFFTIYWKLLSLKIKRVPH